MAARLYLLRHGQAGPPDGGDWRADHQRELTAQGQAEIRRLAQRADALGMSVEVALVSSATRTRQTAELMGLNTDAPSDALYNADAGDILHLLHSLPDSCQSAMVVAHNPGISWLAASLLRPHNTPGFAPGTLLEIELAGRWSELAPQGGQLVRRLNPPNYA